VAAKSSAGDGGSVEGGAGLCEEDSDAIVFTEEEMAIPEDEGSALRMETYADLDLEEYYKETEHLNQRIDDLGEETNDASESDSEDDYESDFENASRTKIETLL